MSVSLIGEQADAAERESLFESFLCSLPSFRTSLMSRLRINRMFWSIKCRVDGFQGSRYLEMLDTRVTKSSWT